MFGTSFGEKKKKSSDSCVLVLLLPNFVIYYHTYRICRLRKKNSSSNLCLLRINMTCHGHSQNLCKKKKRWKCLFGDYKGIGNFSVCPCESDS